MPYSSHPVLFSNLSYTYLAAAQSCCLAYAQVTGQRDIKWAASRELVHFSRVLQGVVNLSPYSYFGVMSHDPPVVCIGTCATSTTEKRKEPVKDSQQNILETRLILGFCSSRRQWLCGVLVLLCSRQSKSLEEKPIRASMSKQWCSAVGDAFKKQYPQLSRRN